MDAFLDFFAQMPTWYKLAWIMICLSVSWILEGNIPLSRFNYRKWKHAGVNLIFLSTSLIINVLFGLLTVGIFLWTQQHEFGFLYLIDLPVWVELLLAVLLLDFVAQYVAHYLLHKVKWMWKFVADLPHFSLWKAYPTISSILRVEDPHGTQRGSTNAWPVTTLFSRALPLSMPTES